MSDYIELDLKQLEGEARKDSRDAEANYYSDRVSPVVTTEYIKNFYNLEVFPEFSDTYRYKPESLGISFML
jgi:hypothetical protein